MKHGNIIFALLLGASLLTGCDPSATRGDNHLSDMPPDTNASVHVTDAVGADELPAQSVSITCLLVDGAENGTLLLAQADGSPGDVYTLDATDGAVVMPDGSSASWSELRDGMTVHLQYSGDILETFPAQLSGVSVIRVAGDEADDICGLYLQVLEDLWTVDPGLNSNITQLGVDLSGLTNLSGAAKSAVAWRFGELHGVPVVEGSFEELCEQGYIDREALCWEDGILFSITTDAEAVWNLPILRPEEDPPVLTALNAQKWRSGLGAYYFCDCVAQRAEDGTWTYAVGSEAIS